MVPGAQIVEQVLTSDEWFSGFCMKAKRLTFWCSAGVLLACLGLFLGGLDDLKHPGRFKPWNTAGHVVFWIGTGAFVVSIAISWQKRKQNNPSAGSKINRFKSP